MPDEAGQSAHERVPREVKDQLLDQLVDEFYAECARVFPRGATVTVSQAADGIHVSCDGRDTSHLARRLLDLALNTREIPSPRPLAPTEIVQLLGLALYDEADALTLAD